MTLQSIGGYLALCLVFFGIARLAAISPLAGWVKPLPLVLSFVLSLVAGPLAMLLMNFIIFIVVRPEPYQFMPSYWHMVLSSVLTLIWAMTYRHYRYKCDFNMSFRRRHPRRRLLPL